MTQTMYNLAKGNKHPYKIITNLKTEDCREG